MHLVRPSCWLLSGISTASRRVSRLGFYCNRLLKAISKSRCLIRFTLSECLGREIGPVTGLSSSGIYFAKVYAHQPCT